MSAIDQAVAVAQWTPARVAGLQLGPIRWTGSQAISDVSVEGQRRVLRIGLRERMILDLLDGERTVPGIRAELQAQGLAVTDALVAATVNRLLAFGFVERPFTIAAPTLQSFDDAAATPAGSLEGVWKAPTRFERIMRPFGVIARWPGFVVALLAAIAIGGTAAVSAPGALRFIGSRWAAMGEGTLLPVGIALALAIVWNLAATLTHEGAHVATFRAVSGREARLSVTRLGIVPMLNTQLDGVGLLPVSQRLRVVMSGPLISIIMMLVPLLVFLAAPGGSFLQLWGATALLIDLAVVALALAPYPNTDGTRIIETACSVEQLHAVAFGVLFRRLPVPPAALPLRTRIAIRVYPFVLAATVLVTLLLLVQAIRLVVL